MHIMEDMNTKRALRALAIIPARAGSTRIPGKNTRLLCGIPLIMWSVKAAINSSEITGVVVTTDSPEIADMVSGLPKITVDVPDSNYIGDKDQIEDRFPDLFRHHPNYAQYYDVAVLLQPTSPLRTAVDINLAVRLYRDLRANIEPRTMAMVSVCQQHALTWTSSLDGQYVPNYDIDNRRRSKDDVAMTIDDENGAMYLFDPRYYATLPDGASRLTADVVAPYYMSRVDSLDIDNYDDFAMAEALMAARIAGKI